MCSINVDEDVKDVHVHFPVQTKGDNLKYILQILLHSHIIK